MSAERLIKISKFMSKYLRHSPQDLGLTLQDGGWAGIDDFLTASHKANFHISRDELDRVVATDNKKRYSFDDTTLIRANQGHSVEVDLQPRTFVCRLGYCYKSWIKARQSCDFAD